MKWPEPKIRQWKRELGRALTTDRSLKHRIVKIDIQIDIRDKRALNNNSKYSSLGNCQGGGGEERGNGQDEEKDSS